MPDIAHDFPIFAPRHRVFEVLESAEGLARWWTLSSQGTPGVGETYQLDFGPGYQWTAVMRTHQPPAAVEWELTKADPDWQGSRVGFQLEETPEGTQVRFTHRGWPERNEHYRISCYCWAMYLRILKRYLEAGEEVAYPDRLKV